MELQKKENGRVRFPIYLTRNISSAKEKIYEMAQGEERYGVLISSKAKRLRHYGLFAPQDDFPTVKWFLDDKRSIDSSYSMEIAASEFKIQGLEIDYALVGWDGDYKYDPESGKFLCRHFKANKWNVLKNDTSKKKKKQPSFSAECNLTEDNESDFVDNNANIRYLINAYRVLLTRARQGMVIFIPSGDMNDETVLPKEYNDTFEYLKSIGIPVIE